MIGFQIAQLGLDETLSRIDALKDIAVYPLDEEGELIDDDNSAEDSAREIRLLLQRLLEIDVRSFLVKMRELYFHLFSVDHDHYKDLLMQAAQKDPAATRDFCLSFLFSDDVIFVDDQKNLADLIDVLETIGLRDLEAASLQQLRDLLKEPFFRRPSLHARTIRLLLPHLEPKDLAPIRRLFELDLIPPEQLSWSEVQLKFAPLQVPPSSLVTPVPRPELHLDDMEPEDLEDLRWGVGLEGLALQIVYRYLGCMIAAGPEAIELFYQTSEKLPETAFQRRLFETHGHRLAFERGLEMLREDILRDVHHSGLWFREVSEEIFNPAGVPVPRSPWPAPIRFLPALWMEFANPTDGSEFALEAAEEIKQVDQLIQKLNQMLAQRGYPSADDLAEGEKVFESFLGLWNRLLSKASVHLDVIP